MSDSMRKNTFKKVLAILILGFALLVLGRFVYSFWLPAEESARFRRAVPEWGLNTEVAFNLRNRSNLRQIGVGLQDLVRAGNLSRLEVLEETATANATSTTFDADKEKFLNVVSQRKGKILHERSQGLSPHRSLSMTIGVSADSFQATVQDLKAIGTLTALTVTRTDRTEEFRALLAKKQSSEKYSESLSKLRQAPAGGVQDLIKLEEKILEVQREIENASMRLGDFTPDESLSNIAYTLAESQGVPAYRLDDRALDSMSWAGVVYAYLIGAIVGLFLIQRSIVVLRS